MERKSFSSKTLIDLNSKLNKEITSGEETSIFGDSESIFLSNEQLESINTLSSEEIASVNAKLDFYEAKMTAEDVFPYVFDSCDLQGNMSTYEDGVTVVMEKTNVLALGRKVNPYALSRLIGVPFNLRVASVDRAAKVVKLCLPKLSTKNGTLDLKYVVSREISKALEAGQKPVLWCRVTKVYEDRLGLDILDTGLFGMVDRAHWQKGYTSMKFNEFISVGEYYRFEIQKQRKVEGKPSFWVLSRRELTEDPWDKIDLNFLEEGGVIVVKCVNKPKDKSYWWGHSDRVPGVDIMCDFSTSCPRGSVFEGLRYVCKVKKINTKTSSGKYKQFSAIPFRVFPEDMAKVESAKQVNSERLEGGLWKDEDNE